MMSKRKKIGLKVHTDQLKKNLYILIEYMLNLLIVTLPCYNESITGTSSHLIPKS